MAFQEREYSGTPLTADEIREIARPGNVLGLLNPQRPAYREMGFDTRVPSDSEAVDAILREPNLMYRPIVRRGETKVLGFDADAIRRLVA